MRRKLQEERHRCRDCANSYGWHNESFHDGRMLMCRCRLHEEHEFLLDRLEKCGDFKQRR